MNLKTYWWFLPIIVFALITWGLQGNKKSQILDLETVTPKKFERVITLAPSLTEMVSAIGGADKIIGVTESCDYPPEILDRPPVANHTKLYFERILTLKPDLILVHDNDFINKEDLERLSELGLKVVWVPQPKFKEIPDIIESLGKVLMLDKKADEVARELRSEYAKMQDLKFNKTYKVLIQLERTPLYVAGTKSLISDIVEELGGKNITESLSIKAPYPRISVEAVLNSDPDIILIPISNGDRNWFSKMNKDWQRYPYLSAVKGNKICLINASTVVRPGPRIFNGVKEIALCAKGSM